MVAIHFHPIMWTYNKQLLLRWVFFVIGLLLLGALTAHLLRLYPETLGRAELKDFFTRISVDAEFLPLYAFPAIFLIVYGLILLGCPSFLVFPPLYLLSGFTLAFCFTVGAQLAASLTTIYYSRKKALHQAIPYRIISAIIATKISAGEFCFWTRLYINYPQRTIDLLASVLLKDHQKNSSLLLPTLAATALRNLLPAIWTANVISLITDISINQNQATSSFLFWSSLLVAYIALPKVPELLICKANIKPVLEDIENWNSAKASAEDENRRPRNKIKLGMQSRPTLQ